MEDALGVKRKERVPRAGIGLAGYISLILVPYREEGSKGGRSLGRRNARATNHIPPPSIFIRWVDGHPSTTEGPRRLRMRENIGSNVPIPTWGGTRRGGTKKCGMTNVRLSAECRWRGGVWGAGPGASSHRSTSIDPRQTRTDAWLSPPNPPSYVRAMNVRPNDESNKQQTRKKNG